MNGASSDASTSTDDVKGRPLCLFYFTQPFGVLSPEPPTALGAAPAHLARAFLNMEPVAPFYWPGPGDESCRSAATGDSFELGAATVHARPVSLWSAAPPPRSSLLSSELWFETSCSPPRPLPYHCTGTLPYHRTGTLPPLQLPSARTLTGCSEEDIWPRKFLHPEKFSLPPIELPPALEPAPPAPPVPPVPTDRRPRRLGVDKQRRRRRAADVRRVLAALIRRAVGAGKLVSTKWSNLRDAWMRANKNDVKKSGAGAKFSKPYIYKEQMSFLQKVAEPNRTHDSVKKRPTDTCPEAPAAKPLDTNLEVPSTSKKQKHMNLDEKMSQFLDSRLPTDKSEHPMLSFFKGVLRSVTSFDDDETLEFQSGVLSLIQKIKKQRENRLYSSNYSWHSQSRDHMQQSVYSSQNQNVHPPGNQNMLPSVGYGHSTRQPVEPASPAWSEQSSSTQDSDLNFSNF